MIIRAILVTAILLALYILLVRPWMLRMGATPEEIRAALPGDGLVVNPNWKYTQAVDVHAPREIVWGYVVQMGYKRAGWYNWDFINRLAGPDYFYEGKRSAQRIIPELQHLREGDKVNLTPQLGMKAEIVRPPHTLMMTGRVRDDYLVVWTYYLKEIGRENTRLLVRWRSNQNEGWGLRLLNYLIMEPGGGGIQQSQNLKGIKIRSEKDFQAKLKALGD